MAVCLSVWLAKCHLPWSFLESSFKCLSLGAVVGHRRRALGTPHFAAAAASGGMRNAGMEWNGFWGLPFTTSAEPWHFNSSSEVLLLGDGYDYTLLACCLLQSNFTNQMCAPLSTESRRIAFLQG